MLDIIGAISLTALFALFCAIVVAAIPAEAAARRRGAALAIAWFALIAAVGATGIFSAPAVGPPAIGVAILTPVVVWLVAAVRSPAVRQAALATPLPVLVGVHAGRALGIFFLLLLGAERLPPTFAMAAGWGDIAVAAAALPLAWAISHRVTGWWSLTCAWNLIGFADLVTAVALGVGSASGSPLRFIFESPGSNAVGTLPWVLIPAVLVPLYLITHLAILAHLRKALAETRGTRQGGAVTLDAPAGVYRASGSALPPASQQLTHGG